MPSKVDFALLAPVPHEHLEAGIQVARDNGYVCYGSQNWELFKLIDELRGPDHVPILFYPSYEDTVAELSFKVCYVGEYIKQVIIPDEKRKDDVEGHRPESVDKWRENYDSPHHWALFWRVQSLRRLEESEQFGIGSLSSYKTGRPRLNVAPRGPSIIARPAWLV